jgi:polyhydroxyalkanoate synthase
MDEGTALAVHGPQATRQATEPPVDGSITPAHLSAATASCPPPPSACEQIGIPNIDRLLRAATGHITQGISPHAIATAWFDWTSHFARSPQRQVELAALAVTNAMLVASFATQAIGLPSLKPPFAPEGGDHRFADCAWRALPYVLWQQAFLAVENWWNAASTRSAACRTGTRSALLS